ncbi:universal stress protein [Flagellimonas pacifica]|uniref:Nucleotide-binding universal stress protein, UspA family n=1 Tax=Flagellimonas pacifica TaxID=1247520 RepID=A0A285MCB2_9FLAO|nr:universal stress protein [Allomuricauda parva]SNY94822.1 Nucleotide-binding universal stress protein, UspA family [Allomuricauda parva]
MESKNYRILVLSDLRKTSTTILKNTASLAKMIGGEIALLHVKQPLGVVKQDNQLSAVRSINDTYTSTKSQINALVNPITEDYGVKISTTFKVGNVKEEIKKKIEEFHPDIIVLGQRKSKPFKLLGSSITKHIMSTFDGLVLIASHEQKIGSDKELSLGTLNSSKNLMKMGLLEQLMKQSSQPLKLFKIKHGKTESTQEELADRHMVEYVFEPQDNAINNMSTYLTRTNVDLLFMDLDDIANTNINVKNVIGKFNVPFLLAGKQKSKINNSLN